MIENSLLPMPHYADVSSPTDAPTSDPAANIGIRPTSA
jgi:hypothetical protein